MAIGLAIGVVESMLGGYVSSTYNDVLLYALLFGIIILRPEVLGLGAGTRLRKGQREVLDGTFREGGGVDRVQPQRRAAPSRVPRRGPPEGPAAVPRVRRRDPVPLGAGICIAAVGSVVLAAMNGSYLGLTVTTGICYAIVTVGMVLQLGYSRQLAFSPPVFMGLGAYGVGVLETKYGFSSLESLLAVIGLAAVASLLIGAVVTRAPGLALALATLLLPLFIYELATYSNWLGSFSGITEHAAPTDRAGLHDDARRVGDRLRGAARHRGRDRAPRHPVGRRPAADGHGRGRAARRVHRHQPPPAPP